MPVLFVANACSACTWGVLMALHALAPGLLPAALVVAPLSPHGHLLVLLKASIVAASWACSYAAVKHLPVSITAPVRGTGPVWTLLAAAALLGEHPTLLQDLGVVVTILSFMALTWAGRAEGINLLRSRWSLWLAGGLFLNSASALMDRYLFGTLQVAPSTGQAWFSVYLALIFLPMAAAWRLRAPAPRLFHMRWSVVTMSTFLLAADFAYFHALSEPDGLVSIVSVLRRSSTVVAFLGGVVLMRERGAVRKLPALGGVLAGVGLTLLGRDHGQPHGRPPGR